MKLHQQISQRVEQGLALMPKMLQSIEVLQLATVDLVQLIEAELEQNETLEVLDAQEDPVEIPEQDSREERSEELEFERVIRGESEASDAKQAMLESLPARTEDLLEHLRIQMALGSWSSQLVDQVIRLGGLLDDRGLLTGSDEELLEALDGDPFEEALSVLQSLEPRGLGARSPIDAMLLQVSEEDPDYAAISRLLTEHLEALAKNKVPEVARAMGFEVSEVCFLLEQIRELDPHPGSRFNQEAAAPIRPELWVRHEHGRIEVLVDDGSLPALTISDQYHDLLGDKGTEAETKTYLRKKMQSARDLMSALRHRKATLARVGAAVLEHQRAFLERGKAAIRPLKMADIAEQLDLHTSTVSRAIAGKYVQTDQGIFPLRDFFDGARARGKDQSGGDQGRLAVHERIKGLVASEDPRAPLSDDELVKRLAAAGVRVARRTVSKYRKELEIPSSWQRRRFGTES
ncbi:MAG: RNA polymerase factor sigma-54 [Planctomycetota bacterium]|jgi:RNA polymerase sigma-54 factor